MLPESFHLAGFEWKVVQKKTIKDPKTKEPLNGLCAFEERKLYISTNQPKENQLQAFYHELFHALFFVAAEEELCYDERLVDVLGSFMHQYDITKVYR